MEQLGKTVMIHEVMDAILITWWPSWNNTVCKMRQIYGHIKIHKLWISELSRQQTDWQ